MTTEDEAARSRLLARSWDEAAPGYERYFVPRFAPWTEDAIAVVAAFAESLPPGPAFVPCCGPGQELPLLAARLPGRRVVGIDLSHGMIARARTRVDALGAPGREIELETGDAQRLAARGEPAALVLSCFGLQQLPRPEVALEDWARALSPGGLLAVVYWPPEAPDGGGPFELLRHLVRERLRPVTTLWEGELAPALQRARLELVDFRRVAHPMRHESPGALFDALAGWGPLRATAIARGPGFMAELRAAFTAALPPGPVEHRPEAGLIVARAPARA